MLEFFTSAPFLTFSNIFGIIGDVAVLVLMIYTLYITAFSRKLEYLSPSVSYSTFYGNKISLTFMNKSLHAIPIQRVFLLKKDDNGEYLYMSFADFDSPVIVESWGAKRVETEPFSSIRNWDDSAKEIMPDDMIHNVAIVVCSGTGEIWLRHHKSVSLRDAKKAYKKRTYKMLTVHQNVIDGKSFSEQVNRAIYIRMKDINGQNVLNTYYGIAGYNNGTCVLLNEAILGYNVLSCPGNSPEEIVRTIQEKIGISEEDIWVRMV